jgi:membrane fusion protein (multidrug efflux system)
MPAQHSARPLALLLLAIAAALPMAGCQEAAKPAAKAPPVPEVGVVTLRPERVALSTELPGRTAAFMMAEVRPQVGGIVRERPFREGAEIAKGDLLYQIDPAPYRAAHESAKAGLAKAEASLASQGAALQGPRGDPGGERAGPRRRRRLPAPG